MCESWGHCRWALFVFARIGILGRETQSRRLITPRIPFWERPNPSPFPNLKMGPSYSGWGPELPRAGGGAKVPSAFFHASANANGALRDNRYHVIAAFMNISGMIMLPVNKSTIGYCSPFVVDGPFPLIRAS